LKSGSKWGKGSLGQGHPFEPFQPYYELESTDFESIDDDEEKFDENASDNQLKLIVQKKGPKNGTK
jgi:hypothetical protein